MVLQIQIHKNVFKAAKILHIDNMKMQLFTLTVQYFFLFLVCLDFCLFEI